MSAYFDIIVVKINKADAKRILARHLASDSSVHLSDALVMLEHLPIIYSKDVPEKDVADITARLRSIGVDSKALLRRREGPSAEDPVAAIPAAPDVAEKPVPAKTKTELRHASTMSHPSDKKESHGTSITFDSPSGHSRSNKKPATLGDISGMIVLVVFVAATITFIWYASQNHDAVNNIALNSDGSTLHESSGSKAPSVGTSGVHVADNSQSQSVNQNADGSQQAVSSDNKKKADSYVDSAKTSDASFAEKYYRMAISLNPGNIKAWNGLVSVCRSEGKVAVADSLAAEMSARFGSALQMIEKTVSIYGELASYSTDQSGVCRIEYDSRAQGRDALERETYDIVKAAAAKGGIKTITIFASTGNGSGMLVRMNAADVPELFGEYEGKADIKFLE